jgi:hypothetical protein
MQVKDLEELCAAQQNSLEEGEEKFRALQDEQDQLHHTALAAKAQLVTAQAQVRACVFCVSERGKVRQGAGVRIAGRQKLQQDKLHNTDDKGAASPSACTAVLSLQGARVLGCAPCKEATARIHPLSSSSPLLHVFLAGSLCMKRQSYPGAG